MDLMSQVLELAAKPESQGKPKTDKKEEFVNLPEPLGFFGSLQSLVNHITSGLETEFIAADGTKSMVALTPETRVALVISPIVMDAAGERPITYDSVRTTQVNQRDANGDLLKDATGKKIPELDVNGKAVTKDNVTSVYASIPGKKPVTARNLTIIQDDGTIVPENSIFKLNSFKVSSGFDLSTGTATNDDDEGENEES